MGRTDQTQVIVHTYIGCWCGPYSGRLKVRGQLKIRPGNGEWVEDQWKFMSNSRAEQSDLFKMGTQVFAAGRLFLC